MSDAKPLTADEERNLRCSEPIFQFDLNRVWATLDAERARADAAERACAAMRVAVERLHCSDCGSRHNIASCDFPEMPAASATWPFVLEFAQRMEAKLETNRHKAMSGVRTMCSKCSALFIDGVQAHPKRGCAECVPGWVAPSVALCECGHEVGGHHEFGPCDHCTCSLDVWDATVAGFSALRAEHAKALADVARWKQLFETRTKADAAVIAEVCADHDKALEAVKLLREALVGPGKRSHHVNFHSYGCAVRGREKTYRPSHNDIEFPAPEMVYGACDCGWVTESELINTALATTAEVVK